MLIELVRNRSFLYDTSQKEYRDNGMRENGWKSIGMQMGISSKIYHNIGKIIIIKLVYFLKYG